jgi:hypothetical protein
MEYLSRPIMIPLRRFRTARTKSRFGIYRLCWESLSKSMKSASRALAVIWLSGSTATTLLADDDSAQSRRIDLPVPIGHDVKGLRLPIRNDQGKVDMQFDIESARRIDDQNIEMHTVTIQTYNQQTFKPDAKIDLESSTMNLDTEVILTKEPVRITRDDFFLTADSGEFNSKTRHGAVFGNIHLVIYNRNDLQTKPRSESQQQSSQ